MTGKLFPYWISASLAFFITVIAAIYFFEIPRKASMISLFFLSAAFIFAAIGFSAFIASICNNELTFTRISIAYTVPAFVLSGYTWPLEAMDTIGKIISYNFPLSYFSNTFRELMIAGYSPVLYRNIFILFLFGLVFTSITMLCYIRRTKLFHRTANF